MARLPSFGMGYQSDRSVRISVLVVRSPFSRTVVLRYSVLVESSESPTLADASQPMMAAETRPQTRIGNCAFHITNLHFG